MSNETPELFPNETNTKVKLIAVTAPVMVVRDPIADSPRQMSAEELLIYTARVSAPENQHNLATAPRLLAYCIRKRHWSVFEQADVTVEITTSRAISAQIIRHKSFSFQEFSQRYAPVTKLEPIELRKQGMSNRQGGVEPLSPDTLLPVDEGLWGMEKATVGAVVDDCLRHSLHVYKQLLSVGAANECARMVLPLCSQTRLYMKGNLRSWIHYLLTREEASTQKEHRIIANQIRPFIQREFPNTIAAVDMILAAKAMRYQLRDLVNAGGDMRAVGHFVEANINDIMLAMET